MTPPHWGLLRDPGHFLSLGAGTGLVPRGPGTAGTLLGVLIYWPLTILPIPYYFGLVVLFFVVGIGLCERTATAMDAHDHPSIVWDEIVGYFVTMAFVAPSLVACALGFVVFRLLDIFKPWPISAIDRRVGGGLGIMLDDLVAGLAAGLCLAFIEYLSYI